MKTGVTGAQTLFLMTDTQIVDDKFLIYVNDILSAGYIPELFATDELDAIRGKVRSEAKSMGCGDTPDELFNFFVDKVRKNLHMGLCFSPVSASFRDRARKFPGLINCTAIDWFHPWPRAALVGVADKFMSKVEFPSEEIQNAISEHMAEVHLSVAEANVDFKRDERRNNYTTPTSFLELISFYQSLLGAKRGKITDQISRLEIGLDTMKTVTEQVEDLQKLLEVKMVDVEAEQEKTNELIEIVKKEQADAKIEQDKANE